MAKIVAHISSIAGKSSVAGYTGQLDALAIRETLECPAGSGSVPGQAKHSDIMLIRERDKGSPKLALACAGGTDLGDVTIRLYNTVESVTTVYMTYILYAAYVSRYEYDTADAQGLAYMPHYGPSGQPPGQPMHGAASLLDSPPPDKMRLSPRPMVVSAQQQRGLTSVKHVERVWFNAAKVKWIYHDGSTNVEGQWNIGAGSPDL